MTAYTSYNDAGLLELLRAGDKEAFTELYNRYWKVLFHVAANKIGNLAEAEEMVQDLFLDIWKRREGIEITSTFRTYLAVALKYRVFNLLARRNKRLRYESYARTKLRIADDSTEQWLGFHELDKRIARLVADLPDKCRLVYQLKKEKGYSQKDIALQLQISEKAVEAHITRALKLLRTGIRTFFSLF
ncbi:RNA polymerase sigma factor [Puia dinghuensis]|uniref:DNA-directed RNA polymerase sigma-70 factor n=1 Tax=Puia dinghuensis TaxID=1792502 RepID=A0A8J2UC90_9BACT|nr:RNA polymerase sigma-70 factor [Puia dinghuensis]GGA97678.1 DNA-directed RNA polymerase sigma-70 factor [Puia dinghuensis]